MAISLVVSQFVRFFSPDLKIILVHMTYEDGAECYEMSAHTIQ